MLFIFSCYKTKDEHQFFIWQSIVDIVDAYYSIINKDKERHLAYENTLYHWYNNMIISQPFHGQRQMMLPGI